MQKIGEIATYKALSLKASSKRRALSLNKALSLKEERARKSQNIAQRMADKLNRQDSYRFFLKCAWHLSESTIWDIVDRANSKSDLKSPSKWAIAALASELNK